MWDLPRVRDLLHWQADSQPLDHQERTQNYLAFESTALGPQQRALHTDSSQVPVFNPVPPSWLSGVTHASQALSLSEVKLSELICFMLVISPGWHLVCNFLQSFYPGNASPPAFQVSVDFHLLLPPFLRFCVSFNISLVLNWWSLRGRGK